MPHAVLRAAYLAAPVRVSVSASVRREREPAVARPAGKDKMARRGFVSGTLGLALAAPLARPARADVDFKDGPEGIRYADIKPGTGAEPFEGDVLKVNYQLDVDGKKVDFAKFFVFSGGAGEVIKGWDMAVMGSGDSMPPADRRVAGCSSPRAGVRRQGAGCSGSTGEYRIRRMPCSSSHRARRHQRDVSEDARSRSVPRASARVAATTTG